MANKSKNISFRYDLERFAFVKEKEKLEKDQQVLDFLVNKYWWEHKVAKPTHKDTPPIEYKPADKMSYDGPKPNLNLIDEAGQWSEPKAAFEVYLDEIEQAKNPSECEGISKAAKNDIELSYKQKEAIKLKCVEKSKEFDF